MKQLLLALYAEGRTDERFLPLIIQRAADRILRRQALTIVDVLEVAVLEADFGITNRAECILSVAQRALGYHALIVHADADAPTTRDALEDRFMPGYNLVQESANNVCRDLLPIIPIRMTEAWLMADYAAFREVVGTDLSAEQLGFPEPPRQVEAIHNPKHELNMALHLIFSPRRRRRKASLGQYYEPLARRIDLDILERVPAFQEFTDELTKLLSKLHLVRDE